MKSDKIDKETAILKENSSANLVNEIYPTTNAEMRITNHLLKLKKNFKEPSNGFTPPVAAPKVKLLNKILLAEDDLLLRKSLAYFLSDNGFKVVHVADGAEAVKEIKKSKFDLMIIDLKMPHIGGMEIINMVRNELKLNTPVIVLTSSGVEEVELESFAMGASEFISKPFSPSVLKARIDKLIE
jgi:CheY-like chemotaxis protein